MNERDAFLRAILADPADDTARLVFADWLQENGQERRAEFIRVQVELARAEADPAALHLSRWAELCTRDQALRALWREWLGPAAHVVPIGAPFYEHAPLARGFVSSVACSATGWLTHGDAILAEHPVTAVRLTTRPVFEGNEDECWFSEDPRGTRVAWVAAIASRTPEEVASGVKVHLAAVLRLRFGHGVTFRLPPLD